MIICNADCFLASNKDERDNSSIAWVRPSKQRYGLTNFFLDETKYCPIYLCNKDVWYQILLNLKLCNIITQSLALKRLNEMVHLNNGFKKYTQLSNSMIDKKNIIISSWKAMTN